MSTFDKINQYKTNVMMRMLENDSVVKALANDVPDFLDQPMPEDKFSLIYENMFPYSHVPGVSADAKSYITLSFDDFRYTNNEFKSGVLNLYVFSHESLVRTHYGLRYDYIRNELDEMFNKSRNNVGAFSLQLSRSSDLKVSDDYFGVGLSYLFYDFQ